MHCRRILYSVNYLTVTFCSFPLALEMLLPFLPYHALSSLITPLLTSSTDSPPTRPTWPPPSPDYPSATPSPSPQTPSP